MDEFEEKRGMVKMLLDMLKRNASDEVSGSMKAPEGMPKDAHGLEIEKVSVMPGDHKDDMPEDMSPEGASMADEVLPKGSIAEEMKRAPEMAAEDDKEHMEDEGDDDMPAAPFMSLMKKKGKK